MRCDERFGDLGEGVMLVAAEVLIMGPRISLVLGSVVGSRWYAYGTQDYVRD